MSAHCEIAGCGHALSMHNDLGYCRSRTTPDGMGSCSCESTESSSRTVGVIRWQPGRWWRVMRDGQLWCETSNEQEARESMRAGDRLERLWVRNDEEWRGA